MNDLVDSLGYVYFITKWDFRIIVCNFEVNLWVYNGQ